MKEQRSEMLTRVLCPVQNVTIVRLEYRLSEAEGTRLVQSLYRDRAK